MQTSSKRIAVLALALLLLVPAGASLAPRPAHAFLGMGDIVLDPVNLVKNTITSVASNLISSATDSIKIKEYILDPIAYAVAKAAVQSIVQSVVTWANNGFNGSPAFVVNIQVQLGQILDTTASRFFTQFLGTSLDSPFQKEIASVLQSNFFQSTAGNAFFLLNKCTLGGATTAVSSAGYDFSKGGLSGWHSFSVEPQNNAMGLFMNAQNELNRKVTAAIEQARGEISQNHGFLSWRGDCKLQGIAPPPEPVAPVVTTNPDGTYNFTTPAAPPVKDNGTNCLDYDVVTPGSLIEGKLQQAVGSGIEQLISADEIDEIVGALAQGLIKNILGGSGLSGTSKPQGGGSDYFTQTAAATDNNAANNDIASNLSTAIAQEKTQLMQYQSSWQTIGAAANTAKNALTGVANSGGACTFGEGGSASAVLQNVVNPVVDQANTASAKAATSLSTLASIQAQLAGVKGAAPTTDALTAAGLNYQQFLTSPNTPSTSDIGDAQAQSQDVSGGSTSTTTPAGATTLLSEMNNIVKEAAACAVTPTSPTGT